MNLPTCVRSTALLVAVATAGAGAQGRPAAKAPLPIPLSTAPVAPTAAPTKPVARPADAGETSHLRNIRQLTFGGSNAEAYFSRDGQWITYQAQIPGQAHQCDLQYVMKVDGTARTRVSPNAGKTTCHAQFVHPEAQFLRSLEGDEGWRAEHDGDGQGL